MEISSLQQFLALAQALNFTQAAEQCFVTQPTLSRNIANLEKELGVQLFRRNRKTVTITAEGQELLQHVYRIVEEYEQILAKTSPYRTGEKGNLKIGYSSYPYILSICMEAAERLEKLCPELGIEVIYGEIKENFHKLLNDQLDGVFMLDCGLEKHPELSWEQVSPSLPYALLNHKHPLAQRKSVSLRDLSEEPFIMVNREDNPDLFDFRLKQYLQNGIRKENIIFVTGIKELMVMVSREQGVAVLNEDGHLNTIESIIPVAIADGLPPLHLCFVWKKRMHGPCMNRFVETLRKIRDEQ